MKKSKKRSKSKVTKKSRSVSTSLSPVKRNQVSNVTNDNSFRICLDGTWKTFQTKEEALKEYNNFKGPKALEFIQKSYGYMDIPFDIPKTDLFDLMQSAYEANLSLNDFVNYSLRKYIESYKKNIENI